MGDDVNLKSRQDVKVICIRENVDALLCIVPVENNWEQREAMTEDNEQKQIYRDISVNRGDRRSKWSEEMGVDRDRSSKDLYINNNIYILYIPWMGI